DDEGDEIKELLRKKNLSDDGLQTDLSHPTGKVGVTLHSRHEISYEIFENAAWDYLELTDTLEDIASETQYIIFGSLISRNQISKDTLFHLLNHVPVKVFDVNLRSPFYSKQIIQELMEKADIVKMNEEELDIIAGWFGAEGSQISKVKSLYSLFHLKTIIVTAGAKGGFAFSNGNYAFKEAYKVNVIDTVGAGDAFLAGFLSSHLKGTSLQQSLEAANKMGALVSQKRGGCPEYDVKELDKISKG
ncbi:MAG: PfkB family carbohydrate kinase, partial [Chitinophagaceae bacterium]